VHAIRASLVRVARVVTPNIPEAEALADMRIRTRHDMRVAAERILKLRPAAVIVKGGHLEDPEVVDVVCDGSHVVELTGPRIKGPHTHGTGCTFSAAIAAHLALGRPVIDAAAEAKAFVAAAMRRGIPLGAGHRPLDHFWLKGAPS
jgi:hydroxymethylpyrimidine/phosphomethylpyrimidine kinase